METIAISNALGIEHPPAKKSDKIHLTTDFVVTRKKEGKFYYQSVAIKPYKMLDNQRVREKLMLEKVYWENNHVPWTIVTEKNIDFIKAQNIWSFYSSYF